MSTFELGVIAVFCVMLFGLIAWFFPRHCKYCGRWVMPGTRYVWFDWHGYNATHFDLHNECAKRYFDGLK
jgi:hypothetical protein